MSINDGHYFLPSGTTIIAYMKNESGISYTSYEKLVRDVMLTDSKEQHFEISEIVLESSVSRHLRIIYKPDKRLKTRCSGFSFQARDVRHTELERHKNPHIITDGFLKYINDILYIQNINDIPYKQL